MDWKTFFKPTLSKIVLFFILFFLTFYYMATFMAGGPTEYGGPFNFFHFGGSYGPPGQEPFFSWNTEVYSWGGLIADIIIWYLVVCVIFFLYGLTKKK